MLKKIMPVESKKDSDFFAVVEKRRIADNLKG